MTEGQARSDDEREWRRHALDAYFARATGDPRSGLADYIQRLRREHRAVVNSDGMYMGCACGGIPCNKDLLLAWADELIRSYEGKVQEFAAETARVAAAEADRDQARERTDRAEAALRDAQERIAHVEAACAQYGWFLSMPIQAIRAALAPSVPDNPEA